MSTLSISCRCGEVQGKVSFTGPRTCNHLVCYCDDYQRFANHLNAHDVMDVHGGTEIIQVTPRQLTVDQGIEHLRVLRLSDKGILRWYTDCCKTPFANTVSAALPVVGVLAAFIKNTEKDTVLGPIRYRIQGQHALDAPADLNISPAFPKGMLLTIMGQMAIPRLRGFHQPNPLSGTDKRPIVKPQVIGL
ncbi:MAG: hypothetical protein HOI95_04970 [Chromatiales bacterium]|jgi:hypothetical protein|nr:hypothetical protein [Chromatiales bacterium]